MLGFWLPLLLTVLGLVWFVLFAGRSDAVLRLPLWALIVLGVGARALAFGLPAFEEVDFWRYFWDGRQVANGWSPYVRPLPSVLSPPEFLSFAGEPANLGIWQNVRADTHGLSTIYAPLAVLVFAVLDLMPGPPSLAYAASFLGAEALAFWALRRTRERRALWFLGLNPLLIFVTYNGLHFDIWLLPILIAFILAHRRGQGGQALVWLCLAIALRHWALVLLPLWAALSWRALSWRAFGPWMLAPLVLTAISFAPQLWAFGAYHSGLRVYGQLWEMNDALFLLTRAGLGETGARALPLMAALGASLALGLWRVELARAAGLAVLAMLLLSPTFFPWYWLWLAPFAAMSGGRFQRILALLSLVLPLAYLRFFMDAAVFDTWIVWLQFGPILAALLWWGWGHARRPDRPRLK